MQDLYPYPDDEMVSTLPAAWAFTPNSQRFATYYGYGSLVAGEPVEGGWWRSAALFHTLVAHGLPKTPPVAIQAVAAANATEEAVGAQESAGGLSAPWAWLMLLALAAMLVIRALNRRFRSRSSSL